MEKSGRRQATNEKHIPGPDLNPDSKHARQREQARVLIDEEHCLELWAEEEVKKLGVGGLESKAEGEEAVADEGFGG
jgi:hypothetical protein